ncbi:MAG: tail fiber domain-containing protein [Microbacterium ginsengisoli]|nr:tail fiber domain-containing protein [Microbacterium ginsengisoli]
MANGDAAVAAGMDVVSGSADRRLGYDEINKTRDYIAQRTSTVTPVTKGGTGATTAAGARTNLGLVETAITALNTIARATSGNQIEFRWTGTRIVIKVDSTDVGSVAITSDIDYLSSLLGGKLDKAGGTLSGDLYLGSASAVTSSYVAMYRNGDGRVGISPSARRFKKNITDRAYTLEDLLRIRVVSYQLRASVYGSVDAPTDIGVIAEELEAAGFDEFVAYDEHGDPLSVHYERLALVAIGALQDLAHQLDGLAARLDALEARP